MMIVGRNALYFNDYVLSIQYFNQVIHAKPYLHEPYFYRGLAKFYLDDFSGAQADCSQAIERNPFVVDYYQIRGLSYIRLGEYDKAITDYRKALRFDPENEGLWHNLALCYAQLEEYDQSIGVLDTIRIIEPSYTPALNMRAQIYLQRNDTVAALKDLNASIEQYKYDADVYATRAIVYFKQESYSQAEEDLTYAIHLSPKSLYYINRALVRYNRKDLRGAMADYDIALDLDPKSIIGHYNRGLLRAQVGDDNRSIEDFDFVLTHEPDNTMARFNRALLLANTGDYLKAEDDFTEVLREYPKFIYGYQCRADVRRKMGHVKKAEEDMLIILRAQLEEENERITGKKQQANASDPTNGDDENDNTRKQSDKNIKKYKRLVVADEDMQDNEFKSEYRGKVQHKNVYVELQPLFALTYYNKESEVGRIIHYHRYLEHLNQQKVLPMPLLVTSAEKPLNEDEIEFHFEDIDHQTTLFTDTDSEESGTHYFARGLDFYLVQDLDNAADDYSQAIALNSDLWVAYFNRGVTRYKQAELQRAHSENDVQLSVTGHHSLADTRLTEYQLILADFNKAIDMAPDFAYAYYNRANILSQMKDYRAAIASYDEALRLEPSMAEAYYNRGLTHIYLGDNSKGIADLSKAGELGLYSAYNLIKRFAE